uniref:Uncharacterized protein n=1 Tax=Picocystis salinarum TaxID=88271 RepID=A0A7S3XG37_9CHLO
MDVRVLASDVVDAFGRNTSEGFCETGDDRHDFHDALRRLEGHLVREEGIQPQHVEAMETCIDTLRNPRVNGRANREVCARCEALLYRRSGRGGIHAEANATIERVGKGKTGMEDVRDWTRIAAIVDVFGQELGAGNDEIARISAKQLQKETGVGRRALLRAWTHTLRGKDRTTSAFKDRSMVEEETFAKAFKAFEKIGKESDERTRAEAARLYLALAESKTLRQWKKHSHVEKFMLLLGVFVGDSNMYIRKIVGKAIGKASVELDYLEKANPSAIKSKGQVNAGGGTYSLQKSFQDAVIANQRSKMLGLTEAWVVYIRESAKTETDDGVGEGEAIRLSMQVLSMLDSLGCSTEKNIATNSLFPHPQACIQYIVHEAAVSQLSEKGQLELLKRLTNLIEQDRKPAAAMCMVVLKLAERLLCILGELPTDIEDSTYTKVAGLIQHDSITVRCQAAITASHLLLVSPQTAADRLRSHMSSFMDARDLASSIGKEKASVLDVLCRFQGQGWAVAALLSTNKSLLYGFPTSLIRQAIDVAVQCIVKPSTSSNGMAALISTERDVAFQILAAAATSAPNVLLERHGEKFLKLWTTTFSSEHMTLLKQWKEDAHVLAWELHWRSSALEALTAFASCLDVAGGQLQLDTFMESVTDVFLNALELGKNNDVKSCLAGRHAHEKLRSSTQLYFFQLFHCFHKLPFSHKSAVHHRMLQFAMAPFLEADVQNQIPPACASLREVLNTEDAILGPWFPGNSALEDGLEAFVGGTDGPLPCIWERKTVQEFNARISVSFFPLKNSMANMLVTEQMRCLATVLCQTTNKKAKELCVKLSDALIHVKQRMKAGRHVHARVSTAANIAYVALLFLKSVPRSYKNNEVAKVLYELGVEVFLEGKNLHRDTVLLRASAEIRALATCSAPHEEASTYIKNMCDSLRGSTIDAAERAATCLALGRSFDRIGGMQLISSVPSAMAGIVRSAGTSTSDCHVWALHALWLTARGAGLSFLKKVKSTLNLCVDMLQSYQHEHLMLDHLCAMLATTSVAILGPEFKPGTWYFHRCCNLIEQAVASEDVGPSSELERVLFVQQLILFAPEYIFPAEDLPVLLASLNSLQPVLRSAVVATLRHMVESNALSIIPFEIEGDLFEALDSESDEIILLAIERTLLSLLEAGAPTSPSKWLNLCAKFILVTHQGHDTDAFAPPSDVPVESCTEDPEDRLTTPMDGGKVQAPLESKKHFGIAAQASAPRLRTRKFAANCLVKVLGHCVAEKSRYSQVTHDTTTPERDADILKEETLSGVLQTGVDIGYKIATGPLVVLQAQGLEFLLKLACAFRDTKDPKIEEQGILVQYQAQFLSAIRSALIKSLPLPHLLVGGLRLASAFVTCGIAGDDVGATKRVFDLIGTALQIVSQNEYSHSALYSEEVCRGVKNAVALCFCDLAEFADKSTLESTATQAGADEDVLSMMLQQWYPQLLLIWEDTVQTFFESTLHLLHDEHFTCNVLQPLTVQEHMPRVLCCCCAAACKSLDTVSSVQYEEMIGMCLQATPVLVAEDAWQSLDMLLSALSSICSIVFAGERPIPNAVSDVLDLLMWLCSLEEYPRVSHSALCQILLHLCASPVGLTGTNFDKASLLACALLEVMLLQAGRGIPPSSCIVTLLECFHLLGLQDGGGMLVDSLFIHNIKFVFNEGTQAEMRANALTAMKELVCRYHADLTRQSLEQVLHQFAMKFNKLPKDHAFLQELLELVLYCGSCIEELGCSHLGQVRLHTRAAFEAGRLACTSALLAFFKKTSSSQKQWWTKNFTVQHLVFVFEAVYDALGDLSSNNIDRNNVQVVLEGLKCIALYRTATSGTPSDEKYVSIFLHLLVDILRLPERNDLASLKVAGLSLLKRVLVAKDPIVRNVVLALPVDSRSLLHDNLHGVTKEIDVEQSSHTGTKPKIQLKTTFAFGTL